MKTNTPNLQENTQPEKLSHDELAAKIGNIATAGVVVTLSALTPLIVSYGNRELARQQQSQAVYELENVDVSDPSAPVIIEASTEKLKDGQKDEDSANAALLISGALAGAGVALIGAGVVGDNKHKK